MGSRTKQLSAIAFTAALATMLPVQSARAGSSDGLLSMVNSLRAQRGVPALQMDSALNDQANAWAASMASKGALAHQPPSSLPGSGLRGENVGQAANSDIVFKTFSASAMHLSNMVNADYGFTGVGSATGADGSTYFVEEFAHAGAGGGAAPAPVAVAAEAPAAPTTITAPAPKVDAPAPKTEVKPAATPTQTQTTAKPAPPAPPSTSVTDASESVNAISATPAVATVPTDGTSTIDPNSGLPPTETTPDAPVVAAALARTDSALQEMVVTTPTAPVEVTPVVLASAVEQSGLETLSNPFGRLRYFSTPTPTTDDSTSATHTQPIVAFGRDPLAVSA